MLEKFFSDLKTPVIKSKITSEKEYFRHFNELLKTDFSDNKDLIKYLNTCENTILIMENLQHMFLKKIDGFYALELLFELISETSENILWIGEFTKDTWSYLDKVVLATNYFTDIIFLEKLSLEDIKQSLEKRILDLKIIYLDEISEELFYKQLYKLSDAKISLALQCFVRSIDRIEDGKIYLKKPKTIDSGFLDKLPANVFFTLQSILLHDGLSLKDYALVMDISEFLSKRTLTPLLKKGILVKTNEIYNINPIIYKDIYDYLCIKNYIHA